jgi:hypothetical protein
MQKRGRVAIGVIHTYNIKINTHTHSISEPPVLVVWLTESMYILGSQWLAFTLNRPEASWGNMTMNNKNMNRNKVNRLAISSIKKI